MEIAKRHRWLAKTLIKCFRRFTGCAIWQSMVKILVVEDDKDASSVVCQALGLDGHTVNAIDSGDIAVDHLMNTQYDLVILDWMLPKFSGLEILQGLRTRGDNTPVLMLTGQDDIDSRAEGLDTGADDYLTKPFHMAELCARVKALLRRTSSKAETNVRIGPLTLDPLSFKVTNAGEDIRLAPREFALMEFLMRHPNQNYTAEALLANVWQDQDDCTVDTVRTCIKRLRKKLGGKEAATMLQTSPGQGYSLKG
jgi:two-component system, OmpR family, response regulator